MGHRILYIPKPASGIYYPEYGLLYNWYALNGTGDTAISSNNNWIIPSWVYLADLVRYLYALYSLGTPSETTARHAVGKYLKELGITHWIVASTGNNNLGFNAKGSGYRDNSSGTFYTLAGRYEMWNSELLLTDRNKITSIYLNDNLDTSMNNVGYGAYHKRGLSCKLANPNTTLSSGQNGTYQGNDGKVYNTIAIYDGVRTVEWLVDVLAETKLRGGATIPWYGANPANYFTNAEWAALTTAGVCAYNNTLSNVGPGFSFPA